MSLHALVRFGDRQVRLYNSVAIRDTRVMVREPILVVVVPLSPSTLSVH